MIETIAIVMPLMLSPGPANLVCFALATRLGLKRILAFQVGIITMYAAVALLLGFASTQVADYLPNAAPIVQFVGGCFIIYLGYRLAVRQPKNDSEIESPSFFGGMLLQLLNPKYPVVVLTVFAARPNQHLVVTAASIVAVGTTGLLMYGSLGSFFGNVLSAEKYLRGADIVFGILLSGVGLWIAAEPIIEHFTAGT
jgi:threonine/homoserine/homoserine lactone efflux protein